ncbi:hypothetical protein [Streptomyces sp. NPDC003077]|uniref:TolB family protein n=1 Tax=Streptomyces sp. NPDC003077 TaxID=3154443 RepID=UPI0033ABE820
MRHWRLKAALTVVAGACAVTLPASALASPSPAPDATATRPATTRPWTSATTPRTTAEAARTTAVRGAASADIRRVSVAPDGRQGDGGSFDAVLSANGRTVVFISEATNLVPEAAGGVGLQIYAKDLRTGRVDLVSAGQDGEPAYVPGATLAVSANGRFVVFDSPSRTLDPSDTNAGDDIFLRDRWKGTTELITRQPAGAPRGDSFTPSISANGRYIAFTSKRDDLVPGDTNGLADIFVRDRWKGTTKRVSVASDGTQGTGVSTDAVISPDGRRVAFVTEARNLFPWPGNPTRTADEGSVKRPPQPYRAFGVHDLRTGETRAGAHNVDGVPADVHYTLRFSPDGRYVLFGTSQAVLPGERAGLQGFYALDLRTGAQLRLGARPDGGQPTGTVFGEGLSADHRTAYFTSNAPDLVPGDTNGTWDVFARDLRTGAVTRLSTTPDGGTLTEGAYGASVDRSGRRVVFNSDSAELVPGDTNGARDVFLRRLR